MKSMQPCVPIQFKPVYQSYLWGGRQLVARYDRQDAPGEGPVAESWEVSDREDGMSVVSGGPWAGRTLRSLIAEHRDALLGPACPSGAFPLLIKLIDARETLSVQVHPDDETARQGLGEAKSEAWYVLQAGPGAFVYRGLRAGVDPARAEQALGDGTLADYLERIPVTAGDFIYVPGGTVHAIGSGCLLLEVQQNSNTTYRIFDWNRTGPDGKPRALHLDEARKVIHWTPSKEVHAPAEDGRLVTPYFAIEPCVVGKHPVPVTDPLKGFTVLFVEEGPLTLLANDVETLAATGTTWLLPAALRKVKVVSPGPSSGRMVLIRGSRAG